MRLHLLFVEFANSWKKLCFCLQAVVRDSARAAAVVGGLVPRTVCHVLITGVMVDVLMSAI